MNNENENENNRLFKEEKPSGRKSTLLPASIIGVTCGIAAYSLFDEENQEALLGLGIMAGAGLMIRLAFGFGAGFGTSFGLRAGEDAWISLEKLAQYMYSDEKSDKKIEK